MKAKYHYDNNFTINPKEYGDLLLYQLGEMLSDSGNVVEPHVHLDWYEFTYVFGGAGTIYTNNVGQEITQDCIYLSMPKEIHKLVSSDVNPMRYAFCAFNFKEDSPLHAILKENMSLVFEKTGRCFHAPHYSKYFQHILSYIKNDYDSVTDMLLEYELKTLILRVIRHIREENTGEYRIPKINNIELLCFNVINYIDNNLTTIENLSCLSDEFKYNYAYISRCFKKTTGQSISDYFIDKKLQLAKHLIEEDELSITEIANNLHYSSIYVFSRAFRDKYGVSPKAYRNTVQQNKEQSSI